MRQRDLDQFEALKPKDPAARGGVEISRRIPAEVALKEHNGPTNRQSGELRFAVCLDYQTFMENPPGRAVGRTNTWASEKVTAMNEVVPSLLGASPGFLTSPIAPALYQFV